MKRLHSMIHDDEEQDPLQKQLNSLEMEWDSIKQSISRSNRRSFNTDSTATVAVHHRLFQMQDNSPKVLMSVLQHENQDHDRSAIKVIEEREAEFDNGRLRGRRLFQESDMGSDDSGGTQESAVIEEREAEFDNGRLRGRRLFERSEMGSDDSEVSTQFSYKGSENHNELSGHRGSYPPPSVVVVKSGGHRGSVGRRMIRMTWISVVIMVFALAIVAFKGRGEDEQTLVPT